MDIARLGIAVESQQVDQANRSLERFSQVSGSAERAARGVGTEASKAGRMAAAANDNAASSAQKAALAYGNWERAASMVGRAVGAITAALATGAVARYADQWSDLSARVGLAVGGMELAPAVMERLGTIADNTYSSLSLTAESFIRNSASLRELGMSTEAQLTYLSALNDALVVSGARGDRARQVQDALSKAMALGTLRGDELNAVLFHGGAVAQALAEELGVGQNALRDLAADGLITGEVIRNALTNRVDEFREKSAEMPATLEDAMQRIQNALLRTIGMFDQSTGASGKLAEGIIWVVDNFGIFARAATVAGTALMVAFAPAILSQIAFGLGYVGAAGVAAMNAIRVAVMTNPLGLLAVGVATVLMALYQFRDEVRGILGDELFGIVKGAANYLINSFRAAYEDIQFVFANLPDIVSAAFIGATNVVIGAVNAMINYTKGQVNNLISVLNNLPFMDLQQLDVTASVVPKIESRPAQNLAAKMPAHNAAIAAIMSTDNFASSAKDAAEASRTATDAINDLNAAMSQVAGGDGSGGGAGGGAGGGTAGKAAGALKSMASEAQRAAEASARFVQDTAKGFLTDLRSGLEQGKGFFRSFADAAVNALGKIADKLMDNALSGLFGGGGGFGGILGGLFGVGGRNWGAMSASGKYLFDSGGWTGGGSRSGVAGLVHGQEFVVRAGPAAQHRQLLEAINSGRPVSANNNQPGAANQNGGHTVIELRMSPDVEARIVEQSGNQTVRIIEANNKARQSFYDAGGNPR